MYHSLEYTLTMQDIVLKYDPAALVPGELYALPDGRIGRCLPNLALQSYDTESGKHGPIIAAPPPGRNTYDNREKARESIQKRWHRMQDVTDDVLASLTPQKVPDKGLEVIVNSLLETATNNDSRLQIHAIKLLLQLGGYLRPQNTQQSVTDGMQISLDRDTAIRLLDKLK